MLFTDDPAVIEMTAAYQRGSSLEYIFISLSFCLLGYFNGIGKTTFVMIQGIAGAFLVRIPLSYALSHLENADMCLIGLAIPIAALVTWIACVVYYYHINAEMKETASASVAE